MKGLAQTAPAADSAHRTGPVTRTGIPRNRIPVSKTWRAAALLQRKCACGGSADSTGSCEECRKKKLQRRMEPSAAAHAAVSTHETSIPPIVQSVLRSTGSPLDASTRHFMESRLGHDFSRVRVHADRGAHKSAQAVQARAYTCGSDIVFGAGEYAPTTLEGKELLAHELTHVVQQSHPLSSGAADRIGPADDPAEAEANRVARRVVSSEPSAAAGPVTQLTSRIVSRQRNANPPSQVNCPAGQHGAPANAEQRLDSLEISALLAVTIASMELTLLQLDAVLPGVGAGGGYTLPTGLRIDHYRRRFGLPPAAGHNFRNRLSGATYPSRARALVEEAKSLQDRYSRIADFLGGSRIRYRCITHQASDGNCQADCSIAQAFGCPHVIFLCPDFWRHGAGGQLLIHEAAHALFGIHHGHNFTHADCYAAYAADARGAPSRTWPACQP